MEEKMASGNSNNWLSLPHSPNQTSLQANEPMDNPLQNQERNVMARHDSKEAPKIANFLGVTKSQNPPSDLVVLNEIHTKHSDYLFSNGSLVPVQSSIMGSSSGYDFQENVGNLQTLTLSMGSGNKGSACETSGDNNSNPNKVENAPRRTLYTFGQRTSIYRGVTRHRWTGRYEAHLWDNTCRREGQSRKGRQVYLGGYDKEEKAARAYDLAALKYWGTSTTTNFTISNYEKELEEMKQMTRQEFVASIRRKSSGFSRGASMYRGVTRHHQHGRWQARIGRVAGNKDLYLGTFSTEEEAAEAYDIAAIKFRGPNVVTNFETNRYDVKAILQSNTLPIGGWAAKGIKEAQGIESSRQREEMIALSSSYGYGSASGSAAATLHQYQLYLIIPQAYKNPQPILTLQSPTEMTQYATHSCDPHPFLGHGGAAYNLNYPSSQYHDSFIQGNPTLYQGLMSHMGSSSVVDTSNTGSSFIQGNPTPYQGLMSHVGSSSVVDPSNTGSSFIQGNPTPYQGLMSHVGSSSMVDTSNMGSGNGSYGGCGGYYGCGLGLAPNSGSVLGEEQLGMVKGDYDMQPAGGYGSWSADSVQGFNALM